MEKEPERYYEWMLWMLRKEKEIEKARANNPGTTRNRKDNDSFTDSGGQSSKKDSS
jgi:hypothetical protein